MSEKQKKPFWKKWWFWVIVVLVIGAIGSGGETSTTISDSQGTEQMSNKKEPIQEYTIEDQKKEFEEKIKPEYERLSKKYDELWNTYWVDTMTKLGNGEINQFEAYDQMNALEEQLGQIQDEFYAIEESSIFTDEQNKKLEEYKNNMWHAASSRALAAEDMKKMINENSVTPEKMNEVKSWISNSDSHMITAIASYMDLQSSLGIEAKVEDEKAKTK